MSDTKPTHLEITVDNKSRTVFMSFGLMAELAALVGSVERVPTIHLDPAVSMAILDSVLAPRDNRGKITEPDFRSPEIDMETAEKILDFTAEHVLSFFIRGIKNSMTRLNQHKDQLAEAGSLLSSTESSNSQMPLL